MSRNYRSDSCPRGFASRSNICFKNIKFPRGNYQPIVPRSLRETAARKQNILFNHEGMNVLQFKRTKEKLVVSENQRFNHALPLARSELESGLPCCGRLLLLNVNSIQIHREINCSALFQLNCETGFLNYNTVITRYLYRNQYNLRDPWIRYTLVIKICNTQAALNLSSIFYWKRQLSNLRGRYVLTFYKIE